MVLRGRGNHVPLFLGVGIKTMLKSRPSWTLHLHSLAWRSRANPVVNAPLSPWSFYARSHPSESHGAFVCAPAGSGVWGWPGQTSQCLCRVGWLAAGSMDSHAKKIAIAIVICILIIAPGVGSEGAQLVSSAGTVARCLRETVKQCMTGAGCMACTQQVGHASLHKGSALGNGLSNAGQKQLAWHALSSVQQGQHGIALGSFVAVVEGSDAGRGQRAWYKLSSARMPACKAWFVVGRVYCNPKHLCRLMCQEGLAMALFLHHLRRFSSLSSCIDPAEDGVHMPIKDQSLGCRLKRDSKSKAGRGVLRADR
eukprot:1157683-Pelagomonas_calceolata.AAC.3